MNKNTSCDTLPPHYYFNDVFARLLNFAAVWDWIQFLQVRVECWRYPLGPTVLAGIGQNMLFGLSILLCAQLSSVCLQLEGENLQYSFYVIDLR